MSGPLVSIVVPVYNVESYIEECLQSVCSQTYENLEIICVDDVGNDRSMDVVRSFAVKDCRIKIIEHDKNKGLAEARNTGLEHVSGDYVFFLDSDDWLSIDAIEKFVRSAKVGEPDIVVGQGLAFSDDDTKNTREEYENCYGIREFMVGSSERSGGEGREFADDGEQNTLCCLG